MAGLRLLRGSSSFCYVLDNLLIISCSIHPQPPFSGNPFAQDAAQIPEQDQQPFMNGVLESMIKPLGPPPAPRLAPIQLYDDDDITPMSLSEDTIAVKSSTLAELVRPLDYDGFNEHPYQPIPSVATPSSILFGTQPEPVSFSARVPSSFVHGMSRRPFLSWLIVNECIVQVLCRCPSHMSEAHLPFPSPTALATMLYSISMMKSLSCPGPSNHIFKMLPQLRIP